MNFRHPYNGKLAVELSDYIHYNIHKNLKIVYFGMTASESVNRIRGIQRSIGFDTF